MVGDLEKAISEFQVALPGWWFSVGTCSTSRDASCGPDVAHCPKDLLIRFDDGIHVELYEEASTLADALRLVTWKATEALGA